MKTFSLLFVTLCLTSSCIQTRNIEDRCSNNDLRIEVLVIEENNHSTNSKVKCYSKIQDSEDW